MSTYTVTRHEVEDGVIVRLTWQVEVDDIIAVTKGMFSEHEDEDAEPDPDSFNCHVTYTVTRRDGRVEPIAERRAFEIFSLDKANTP